MTASAFLTRPVQALDGAGVRYMLAGSFASAYHGVPRTTHDIDIVVELDEPRLTALLQALPESRYYVSSEAARDALRRASQFNVIDLGTGWKADLIVKKQRAFSVAEFERRTRATVLGVPVWVVSPEDVIVSKLEWAKLGGGSERQLGDVVGVLRSGRPDREQIGRWAEALGLTAL